MMTPFPWIKWFIMAGVGILPGVITAVALSIITGNSGVAFAVGYIIAMIGGYGLSQPVYFQWRDEL